MPFPRHILAVLLCLPCAAAQAQVANVSGPVNFANDVVPIFTRFGCNSGACHGKSGGQNGFQLSLLGFEPAEDYDFIVKEGRGRRVNSTLVDASLLLRKASGTIAHGGGSKIK